jgi:hypothetical protein
MTKKKETIKLKSGECTIGGAEGQGPKKSFYYYNLLTLAMQLR